MIGAHHVSPEGHVRQAAGLHEVAALSPGETAWVDLEAPTAEERGWLATVGQFHPLAIEDCEHPQRRAKYERYATHAFVVVPVLDSSTANELDTIPLRIFVRPGLVVTVHDGPLACIHRIERALAADPAHVGQTAGRLVHAIIDAVVDEYTPILDAYESRMDALEASNGREFRPGLADALVALRRDLLEIRRALIPFTETVRRLMDSPDSTDDDRLYFRDVLDHLLAVDDSTSLLLDAGTGALTMHANLVNERTNEVMKYLAMVSTFLLPMTVISGALGMNFTHLPAADNPWGFFAACSLMLLSAVALAWAFRRSGWL
jgi:magnesium transporter